MQNIIAKPLLVLSIMARVTGYVHDSSFQVRRSARAVSKGATFWQLPQLEALLMSHVHPSFVRYPSRYVLKRHSVSNSGDNAQSTPMTAEDVKQIEEQKVKTAEDWIEQAGKWKVLAKAKTRGEERWMKIAANQITATAEAARITADKALSTAELLSLGELEAVAALWRVVTAAWENSELRNAVEARTWSPRAAETIMAAAKDTMSAARATAKASAEEQSKGWATVAAEWEEVAVGFSVASPIKEEQGHPNVVSQKLAQTSPEYYAFYKISIYMIVSMGLLVTISAVIFRRSRSARDEPLILLPCI